jgi:cytochrome c peroxidase
VAPDQLGFQHAANAIAAFEADAFTSLGSPLDHYLQGDAAALGEPEKRGALLFFGKANCGACHLGPHLTDNLFHSIGVPQVGPGSVEDAPQDRGRQRVTGSSGNSFQFRTPPLRNVELTGPWMHDGAYTSLDGAVRHYLDTRTALRTFDASQLREDLRGTYLSEPGTLDAMAASIDVLVADPVTLTNEEVGDIVAFLRALTDPAARDLSSVIPAGVPSGLPVGD